MRNARLRRGPALAAALAACLLPAAALLAPAPAAGQTLAFGKNKIQYREFDWRVLQSRHFRVYFYPEEEELAHGALRLAERYYSRIAARFGHEVSQRVPLVLYSSHADFEQTNVSPYFLPEGVAGFTEFLRGRVAMPFNGSWADFAATLEHELVHVFQLARLDESYRLHYRNQLVGPPLWFTEGHADLWSEEWDATADMVLQDLVVHDMVPDIRNLWRLNGTFTLYKVGQHLVRFLEDLHGPDVVPAVYDEMWRVSSFEEALATVTGYSLEELNARWKIALKRRYMPALNTHDPVELAADPLAVKGPVFKAAVPPPGGVLDTGQYYFLSSRTGYTDIYRASLDGPESGVERIVEGQRKPEFESFHANRSRIALSPRGHLAFVSKYHAQDALFLYDVETREVLGHWSFEGLVALSSPSFDPMGEEVVLAGLHESGRQDLYRFSFADARLTPLTRDRYFDQDPAWSPDGRSVVFVSDRNPWGFEGSRNLFVLDLETGGLRALTYGPWTDAAPAWSPDGERIAFASDRDGPSQLHTVTPAGGAVRVTNLLAGLLDPAWTADGGSLVCTALAGGRLSLVRVGIEAAGDTVRPGGAGLVAAADPLGLEDGSALASLEDPPAWDESAVDADTTLRTAELPYRSRYSLDFAQGGVSFEPNQNVSQGVQALLTDQLGDRAVFLQFGTQASELGDVIGRLSVGATYLDLSKRINRGVSVFHYAGTFRDELDFPYFERRAGVNGTLSYPFSRYSRVDATAGMVYSDRSADTFREARAGLLLVNYLSFVRDTSLWFRTGPLDGHRTNVTLGVSTNLERAAVEEVSVVADLRRYFRTGQTTTYAVRVLGRFAEGDYPTRYVLGGSWDLRLYPRRSVLGTRSVLLNQEWRFPALNGFIIGFPFGTMGFPPVTGAVFVDAAQVWDPDRRADATLGSFGVGFRMNLGGFLVLRLDVGKRTDFKTVDPRTRTDFFVGFDY